MPATHTNALDSSVKPSTAPNEASLSSTVDKRDEFFGTTIPPHRKDAAKKKSKVSVVIDEIQLSELNLDKDIEGRLIAAGYSTIQDLVPNKEKNDLLSISILNRKCRREIEAKLKQRKIMLR